MIFFFFFGKSFWQGAQSCDHTAVLATGCVKEEGCGRSWTRGELGETDMPCFRAQSLGCELEKWWIEGRFWRDKGLDHFQNRAEGGEEGWAQSLPLTQGVHGRNKMGPAGQLHLHFSCKLLVSCMCKNTSISACFIVSGITASGQALYTEQVDLVNSFLSKLWGHASNGNEILF